MANPTMKLARTLIQSQVEVPEASRSKLVGALQVPLASSLDLYSQIKQVHWNVIGRAAELDLWFLDRHTQRAQRT